MQVRDLDEAELIAAFAPLLPRGRSTSVGAGDDAAVLLAGDGRVVVSTDVLVQDRHFRTDWGTGVDVGWRAAMQNLADIAAMGAYPTGMVVALTLPEDTPVTWVLDLARGLAAACGPEIGVVGGDLSGGHEIVVAVTVFGDLRGAAPVLRSGARPGDVLAHSGVLGWAAAGHWALTGGQSDLAPQAVAAFLRPTPPLADGPMAAAAGATALLDVSDSLLRDAGRIAKASGVVLDIDSTAIVSADLVDLAQVLGVDAAQTWALTGGEDHGLLATFPPGVRLPGGFRAIGTVGETAARGNGDSGDPDEADKPAVLVDGIPYPGSPGWDHFRRA